jgi:hypothetical protein
MHATASQGLRMCTMYMCAAHGLGNMLPSRQGQKVQKDRKSARTSFFSGRITATCTVFRSRQGAVDAVRVQPRAVVLSALAAGGVPAIPPSRVGRRIRHHAHLGGGRGWWRGRGRDPGAHYSRMSVTCVWLAAPPAWSDVLGQCCHHS